MASKYIGLAALTGRARKALKTGVVASANRLTGEIAQAAPVETGALRGSVHIAMERASSTSYEVVLSTGAEADQYAIVQHEGTEFIHPLGGQAKYVEGPLMAHEPEHLRLLQAAWTRAFSG
jgi:hypothetical protein